MLVERIDQLGEIVKSTERSIGAFDGIDEKVASERALAIRAAITDGLQPEFSLSEALSPAVSDKLQAENHLTAARQASAALATESVAAQENARRSLAEVQAAANAIMSEEIHQIAVAVQSTEAKVLVLRIRLKAGEQIAKWLPGGGATLSRLAIDVMNAPSPREIIGMNRTAAHNAVGATADGLRAYHLALCSDANAAFESEAA